MGELAERFEKLCDALSGGDDDVQGHERALLWGAIAELEQRVEAAEQESKYLLAALSEIVQEDGTVVAASGVDQIGDRHTANGWCGTIVLKRPIRLADTRNTQALIIQPQSAPDPTRLERRAVELIEAGERLLAEYRKSQEVKAG